MSTRAQIRFATRETGQSFNEHPDKIHAQFYKHCDGYPEGLGVDIANSLIDHESLRSSWEIEELQTQHGDLDFIYYVWQKYDESTWISIFEMMEYGDHEGECIFVGRPEKLIGKYKLNTNDDG
mgnify:FL=1|tara:strand:+ start:456 stop:824 length:369 start_codon:yes stop_codon:yes gene_type:complete